MVSTVPSQQEGSGSNLPAQWGLSLWNLHGLPLPVSVRLGWG